MTTVGIVLAGLLVAWFVVGRDDGSDPAGAKSAAQQTPPAAGVDPGPPIRGLDLGTGDRRAPLPGMYDWSKAGFRSGAPLPGDSAIRGDAQCRVTPETLAGEFGVKPNDGKDDTDGIQKAVDRIKSACSPTGSYDKESLLQLPAGQLDISHEIHLDADYLIVRGSGSDPRHRNPPGLPSGREHPLRQADQGRQSLGPGQDRLPGRQRRLALARPRAFPRAVPGRAPGLREGVPRPLRPTARTCSRARSTCTGRRVSSCGRRTAAGDTRHVPGTRSSRSPRTPSSTPSSPARWSTCGRRTPAPSTNRRTRCRPTAATARWRTRICGSRSSP
ncbi:hypothetical protein ACU686_25450 [Yinghuangia aomiensis]